jgi:hypothetical protein
MKNLILSLLFTAICAICLGQKTEDSLINPSRINYALMYRMNDSFALITDWTTEIVIKSTPIIRVKSNGDLYFLPSIFCDCYKCKSFKGLKFLLNIYKTQ